MRPVRTIQLDPPRCARHCGSMPPLSYMIAEHERPAKSLALGAVSRHAHKLSKLLVRHCESRDVECPTVTCRTGPSPSPGNASADSFPMRNRPLSKRTMSVSEPRVARRRTAEARREVSSCASRPLLGAQQDARIGGISVGGCLSCPHLPDLRSRPQLFHGAQKYLECLLPIVRDRSMFSVRMPPGRPQPRKRDCQRFCHGQPGC